MNKQLEELINQIKAGQTNEGWLKKLMIEYLCSQPDVIPTILEMLEDERKQIKELKSELNVRLTFTTYAAMNDKEDPQLLPYQIEQNRRFYEENADIIKTAGMHLWKELR